MLLCQDTQKSSFSFAAFQLIITEVFHCKEIMANTGLQPQGEIHPSDARREKSHKKSGLKSVLKNMAQGPAPDATSALAPCAVLTPIVITAVVAVGHELPFLSKDISWQSCCGHLTDVSEEPRGGDRREGGDFIAVAEEKCS